MEAIPSYYHIVRFLYCYIPTYSLFYIFRQTLNSFYLKELILAISEDHHWPKMFSHRTEESVIYIILCTLDCTSFFWILQLYQINTIMISLIYNQSLRCVSR